MLTAQDLAAPNDQIVTCYDSMIWRTPLSQLSDLERYGDWKDDPNGRYVVPALLSGSDYSGTLVERSNHDAWIRDFEAGDGVWWVNVIGGHGTFAIVIDTAAIPEDLETEVKDWLGHLSDYPLADEDLHTELEIKAQGEAWQGWAESDFRRALEKAHDLDLDEVSADDLYGAFEAAREAANVYWENEQGDSMHIDLDRIVAKVSEETARALPGAKSES